MNRVPLHDTFGGVFSRLDGIEFYAALQSCVADIGGSLKGETAAFDGESCVDRSIPPRGSLRYIRYPREHADCDLPSSSHRFARSEWSLYGFYVSSPVSNTDPDGRITVRHPNKGDRKQGLTQCQNKDSSSSRSPSTVHG